MKKWKNKEKKNIRKNKLPWNIKNWVIRKNNFPLNVNCLQKLVPTMRKLIPMNVINLYPCLSQLVFKRGWLKTLYKINYIKKESITSKEPRYFNFFTKICFYDSGFLGIFVKVYFCNLDKTFKFQDEHLLIKDQLSSPFHVIVPKHVMYPVLSS